MANYIYINDYSKKGQFGISAKAFSQIAENALKGIKDISLSPNKKKSHLSRSIKASIHHDIVHISLAVNATKNSNLQELSLRIQNEISNAFMMSAEHVPFDIQVKFEKII